MNFITHIEHLSVQHSVVCYISIFVAVIFLLIAIITFLYGIYLFRYGTSGFNYLYIGRDALKKRKHRSNMIYIKAGASLIISISFMVLLYYYYNKY